MQRTLTIVIFFQTIECYKFPAATWHGALCLLSISQVTLKTNFETCQSNVKKRQVKRPHHLLFLLAPQHSKTVQLMPTGHQMSVALLVLVRISIWLEFNWWLLHLSKNLFGCCSHVPQLWFLTADMDVSSLIHDSCRHQTTSCTPSSTWWKPLTPNRYIT